MCLKAEWLQTIKIHHLLHTIVGSSRLLANY